jgi:hypothetical protein
MLRSGVLVAVALACAGGAAADDRWEGLDEDGTTANQLTHGAEQLHDLAAHGGVADEDWFRVSVPAHSSFEVVVDGVASTIGSDVDQFLTLVHADASLAQLSIPLLPGKGGRSLTYENGSDADYVGKFARVRSQGCSTACGAEAVYSIRGYDTTDAVPRFNNAGTQVTVLILQNAAVTSPATTVTGNIWFWNEAGALVASQAFALPRWGLLVLNTATVPGLAGQRGAITISHLGGYGQLAGKGVAVEPATGFTFDTPLVHRPR